MSRMPPLRPLPTQVPSPEKGISVKCASCENLLVDDDFEWTGVEHPEKVDHVIRMADAAGWQVAKGRDLSVKCPSCFSLDNRSKAVPQLAFDEGRACCKCGCSAGNSVAFKRGNEIDALYIGEHIERKCARCGYRWSEQCLDHKAPENVNDPETP